MRSWPTLTPGELLRLVALCVFTALATAQAEAPAESPSAPWNSESAVASDTLVQRLLAQPASETLIAEFGEATRKGVAESLESNAAAAQKLISEAQATANQIRPATLPAEQALADLKDTLAFYRRLLAAQQQDIATLEAKLLADPDDFDTFLLYELKYQREDERLYEAQSATAANERLNHVANVLDAVRKTTESAQVAEEAGQLLLRIEEFHKPRIERSKRRLATIGTRAQLDFGAQAESLTGQPLRPDDLAGKVVLLDFWALWCGPCVQGLPKVQQWQDQHGDDDFVVVAVAQREGESSTAPDQAQRMKSLFEEKEITLRGVLVDKEFLAAYCVEGLPHYALIDRTGAIRMVRTGNNQSSLKSMEAEIARLIQERKPK